MAITKPEILNPKAEAIFKKTHAELQKFGMLDAVDLELLAMYANEVMTYEIANAHLGDGVELREQTPNGYYQQNAYLGIRNGAMKNAHDLAKTLGIGAMSRAKGGSGKDKGEKVKALDGFRSKMEVIKAG